MQHSSGVPGMSCFRGHCPLIFLEMGMADVHTTSSFSGPSLSGYRQDLRSHLRSVYILTLSWWDAKSSQANSNFMFNPLFHNNFRLTESLREQYREFPYALHPATPPVNILPKPGPQNWGTGFTLGFHITLVSRPPQSPSTCDGRSACFFCDLGKNSDQLFYKQSPTVGCSDAFLWLDWDRAFPGRNASNGAVPSAPHAAGVPACLLARLLTR